MGANRKLQIEIDRTLKKVAEGIEIFDQIWDKVYDAEQLPLKEKYEADLKKEIKKLQRYRDQIKTWISGTDIKDKTSLVEARKNVEKQMERFKVCEKETKTKMFSKEGLAQAQKQDPREKARNEAREWINNTVDNLTAEVETFDAEIESLQPKKKGKPPARLVHMEESTNRHKAHIARLEQLLRLLDNEAIEAEDLAEAKDMVDDYMIRNQEDFDDFGNPDDLYADLIDQLDNLEAQQPAHVTTHLGKVPAGKDKDKEREKERDREREKERSAALAMKMQLAQGGVHVVLEDQSPEKPPPVAKKVADPVPNKSIPSTPTARAIPATAFRGEPITAGDASEAQSHASGSAPSTPRRLHAPPHPPTNHSVRSDPSTAQPAQIREEQRQAPGSAGPVSVAPGAPTPALPAGTPSFAAAAAAAPSGMQSSTSWSQLAAEGAQDGNSASAQTQRSRDGIAAERVKSLPRAQMRSQGSGEGPAQSGGTPRAPLQFSAAVAAASGQPQQGALGFSLGRPAASTQQGGQEGGAAQQAQTDGKSLGGQSGKPQVVPQSNMAELSQQPAESRGPPAPERPPAIGSATNNLTLLQACANRSIPQAQDSQWGKGVSRLGLLPNPVPTSYPTTKLPLLEHPALFEKLETEALFFAFYYQPESYQQLLAARELKRQSWRYHKQHGAWFQRHEEPKTATEEYEQGTYVYFDYNIMHDDLQSGWCYRLKQDFTFRYDALEDELQI